MPYNSTSGKKGQLSIGAILAIVIFINLIIFSFVMVYDIFEPKKIMEQSIKRDAKNVLDSFKQNLTVTVYRVPVFIRTTKNYTAVKINISFEFPDSADPNSLSLLDSGDNPLIYSYDSSADELIWYSNLVDSGTNMFYMIYLTNTTLSKWNLDQLYTNTTASEDDIYNTNVKLLFDFNGINRLFHRQARVNATPDEIPLVESVVLGTPSGQFNLTNTTLHGFAGYSDANFTVIGDTGRIVIDDLIEDNITFNLVDYARKYTTAQGTTDMIVFYDGLQANDTLNSSLAVIGNMNYTLSANNRTLEVESSSIELYAFAGNYSKALPVLNSYSPDYTYIIGIPEASSGIFEEKYSVISGMDPDEIKSAFNITGDFFIYFKNITGSFLA